MQNLYICSQSGGLVTISEISLNDRIKKADKLSVKLTAVCLAVLLVILSVLSVLIVNAFSSKINSEKAQEVAILSESVSAFASTQFSGSKKALKEELKNYFKNFNSKEKIKVTVCDYELDKIYSHGKINHKNNPKTLENAIKNGQLSVENNKRVLEASSPILINGEVFGAVNVICEYDSDRYAKMLLGRIMLWILLLLVVSGSVIFFVMYLVSKRIKNITQKITDMTNDNRAEKPCESGDDEIAKLCVAFNDFSEKVSVLEKQRTEFVSNASHELKTPLSSIKLMADSIIQTPDIEMDYVREFLSDMNEEVERLNRIVNKLLYITKMDTLTENMSGTLELINLKDVVSGINKNLIPIAEMENKEIVLSANEDILIMANKDILWQAVYNIIDNALKYTAQYGKVEVSLTKENKRAVISVKDNGVGISEEDIDRIFDRFYRVDKARSRATGGTGLGLSIAQSAIEFHNGVIEVTSELNVGSEFRIILPLVEWF